jgi:hypothetical protein
MTNVALSAAPAGRPLAVREITLDRDWVDGAEETFRFVYPRIEQRFSSPLLNDRNYEISGDSDWKRLADRVAERLKPVAIVDGSSRQMRKAIAQVEEAGGHGRVYAQFNRRSQLAGLTIAGVIGETVDLEALLDDYHDYLLHDETVSAIAVELDRIAPLRFSDFDDFKLVERTSLHGHGRTCAEPGSFARCGLLFGYPVETTVSLIGRDWQLPGFAHDLYGN